MPWPEEVYQWYKMNQQAIGDNAVDGMYNAILMDALEPAGDFIVTPWYKAVYGEERTYFKAHYIVEMEDRPLLFMDIQPIGYRNDKNQREAVDLRIREIFRHYVEKGNVSLPIFYGLSCMGPHFAVYYHDSRSHSILPPSRGRDVSPESDRVPVRRWEHNILEPEGEKLMKEIGLQIKRMLKGEGQNESALA